MRKYIPLVLFIFSWPVLCADIHGRVVRVLDEPPRESWRLNFLRKR